MGLDTATVYEAGELLLQLVCLKSCLQPKLGQRHRTSEVPACTGITVRRLMKHTHQYLEVACSNSDTSVPLSPFSGASSGLVAAIVPSVRAGSVVVLTTTVAPSTNTSSLHKVMPQVPVKTTVDTTVASATATAEHRPSTHKRLILLDAS